MKLLKILRKRAPSTFFAIVKQFEQFIVNEKIQYLKLQRLDTKRL